MLFRNDKKDNRDKGGNVRLPLLPLRDIIVFPHMVVPLFVGRQRSIKALEEAVASDKLIFLSTQRDAKVNDPTWGTQSYGIRCGRSGFSLTAETMQPCVLGVPHVVSQ